MVKVELRSLPAHEPVGAGLSWQHEEYPVQAGGECGGHAVPPQAQGIRDTRGRDGDGEMARTQVSLHQMQVSRSASSSHHRTLTAVFATFGAAIGALAGSMPSVMRNAGRDGETFGLDGETFGLGLTLSTLMTVMAMSMGGRIARHASNRQVLLAVLPVFAVSLLAYLTSASPIWFFVAVPLMGV